MADGGPVSTGEHVELVKAWMREVPQPDSHWDHDPDPPRYDD